MLKINATEMHRYYGTIQQLTEMIRTYSRGFVNAKHTAHLTTITEYA
jgi:hypothetical protein